MNMSRKNLLKHPDCPDVSGMSRSKKWLTIKVFEKQLMQKKNEEMYSPENVLKDAEHDIEHGVERGTRFLFNSQAKFKKMLDTDGQTSSASSAVSKDKVPVAKQNLKPKKKPAYFPKNWKNIKDFPDIKGMKSAGTSQEEIEDAVRQYWIDKKKAKRQKWQEKQAQAQARHQSYGEWQAEIIAKKQDDDQRLPQDRSRSRSPRTSQTLTDVRRSRSAEQSHLDHESQPEVQHCPNEEQQEQDLDRHQQKLAHRLDFNLMHTMDTGDELLAHVREKACHYSHAVDNRNPDRRNFISSVINAGNETGQFHPCGEFNRPESCQQLPIHYDSNYIHRVHCCALCFYALDGMINMHHIRDCTLLTYI